MLAALIASICAAYTWLQHGYLLDHGAAPDSLVLWRAARILAAGADPWSDAVWRNPAAIIGAHAEASWRIPFTEPLYYPLPAVLLWLPLAFLPFLVASTAFNALGAFCFVFAITRGGLHHAWMSGSVPFMFAMRFGQWSPVLCAAWFYPSLAGLLVTKPNLGLPMFVARVRWRSAFVCAGTFVIPTLFAPWWVWGWLHGVMSNMGRVTPHPMPITLFSGGGIVFLFALLRWRRPEARLLVGMACVPQLPYWADQLPLMLVPQGRREVIGTLLVTLLGFTAWSIYAPGHGDFVDTIRPFAIVCTYLPALFLVLRRPNTGSAPKWLERSLVRRLPSWIQGTQPEGDAVA